MTTDEVVTTPLARRSFRWRILPAAFIFTIGLISVACGIFCFGLAVYMNLRHGWITPQPSPSLLNQAAFTFKNVSGWLIVLSLGGFAFYCAWLWMRGRWWIAMIATLAWWLTMVWVGEIPRESGSIVILPFDETGHVLLSMTVDQRRFCDELTQF